MQTYSMRLFFLASLLLAGCANKLGDSITVPVGELAMYDAVPKEQSVTRLNNHINDAKIDNMPFLAPHYFREASDIVDKINRRPPAEASTDDMAKADALLDHGEKASISVQNTLATELKLKAQLDELAANEIYPWEYKALIYELSRLIEAVELGSASNIERDKEKLDQSMQELHAKTVQYISSHKQEPLH